MATLDNLLRNNAAWAEGVLQRDPTFFTRLSNSRRPITCG
jgi:carbonic anhydrase